ncbi:T9SS type A sorting domain-containing protein [Psychroflexus planctonicus]|uniref:Secretion system C-terminal sorting domain-containing protein n=1 Tax=Psychroflexus planctonicus TaxID=1526575 RepID=A0ABQ1SEK6_9FLAO|nr:T9SS type A sorting domain-containing protein [Psychroflexus planctonicus]GGE34067.1 hypothetical protein GCM10010832_12770 [Psychroflexus planctonicus]
MKHFNFFLLILCSYSCFSQNLPFNFEGDIETSDFINFDGGTAIVTSNPETSGINTSTNVAQIIRDGGAIYGGSKIELENNLDFSVLTKITMKVYTTAPIGTTVKLKLEGNGPAADTDAFTTVTGEWETLEWVFLGISNELNEVVFMFDFGNVGDGSEASTFYFDDVEQVAGPTPPVPASLPINFETNVISTDFLSYGGANLSVVANPEMSGINMSNTVAQVVKDGGEYWAGSRLFLVDNLDFSSLWQISMKVYTTAPIGTRIKLELEGTGGRSSLDYITTTSGEWETAIWNFNGETNDFDKINFLFDFGNIGDGSASSTFYFDDVEQISGPIIPEPEATTFPIDFEGNSIVDTDFINEDGGIANVIPNPYIDANNPSATVGQFIRSGGAPWAKSKIILTDFFQNMSTNGSFSMKVYTNAPVGTVLKFKIESTDAGFADEKDMLTTVSGEWATYTWDFTNQDGPIYNVISLMLGYTTPNDASENATFLFDDIIQQETLSDGFNQINTVQDGLISYPNPAKNRITIQSKNSEIKSIIIFDVVGNKVGVFQLNSKEMNINLSNLPIGLYIAKVSTNTGAGNIKFIKN